MIFSFVVNKTNQFRYYRRQRNYAITNKTRSRTACQCQFVARRYTYNKICIKANLRAVIHITYRVYYWWLSSFIY